jgi:hypothetical protein
VGVIRESRREDLVLILLTVSNVRFELDKRSQLVIRAHKATNVLRAKRRIPQKEIPP